MNTILFTMADVRPAKRPKRPRRKLQSPNPEVSERLMNATVELTRERGFPESAVIIDAESGAVTADLVQPADRAAVDSVLQAVELSPLDPKTLPWPYNGVPPNVPRQRIGNIAYIPPDPAAGIIINRAIGDPGGIEYIEVNNGRSLVFIVTGTGRVVWEPEFLASEDKVVLERFLASVDYVGPPEEQLGP